MEWKQAMVLNPPFPKNYANEFLMLKKGKGSWLWDVKGKKYLDMTAGIAVNALGHGNKKIARIAKKQMKKLIHVSNLYTTAPAVRLAQRLVAQGDFVAVHFGSSGSEANETALKYARIYSKKHKGDSAFKILSFDGSFHGRTMGALAATATAKYRKGYEPMPEGFIIKPFNDMESLKVLDEKFAAVILEPLQGEGGLNPGEREFAQELQKICKEKNILIIADEIQSGLGRTGTFLASEQLGLFPDIVCLSKPLAAGLPLSATLIPQRVNDCINVGDHGTTFGGGPVTTSVANFVLDNIIPPKKLDEVQRKGQFLEMLLNKLIEDLGLKAQVKGLGLLRGIALEDENQAASIGNIIVKARENGLLVLRAGSNVIRLAPAFVITEKQLRLGVDILKETIKEILL
ncbi:MAG: acetylornithine/succinylornithine family transaminase [Spirochaetaceae bacterium]|jgi:acetylornithine/N-succinyldiaminopimelate aminotransferase|nr:acetylornithine/succinylornithine family transaminase [Spirochaetaceae bacterium]